MKVKQWKKIFHADSNHEKAVVALLVLDKIHFKTKIFTRRDKKGHFIMIKGPTH